MRSDGSPYDNCMSPSFPPGERGAGASPFDPTAPGTLLRSNFTLSNFTAAAVGRPLPPQAETLLIVSTYVPVAAFAVLTLLSGARLFVHRIRCADSSGMFSCRGTTSGRANKFWFHLFLFVFAVSRLVASILAVLPSLENREPGAIVNSLSGCSYITLLLFLEMHWREILSPISSVKARRVLLTWASFWMLNVGLYITVIVSVYVEYSQSHGTRDLYWSNAITDLLLVLIAVSYTTTAIALYMRISRSLGSRSSSAAATAAAVKGGSSSIGSAKSRAAAANTAASSKLSGRRSASTSSSSSWWGRLFRSVSASGGNTGALTAINSPFGSSKHNGGAAAPYSMANGTAYISSRAAEGARSDSQQHLLTDNGNVGGSPGDPAAAAASTAACGSGGGGSGDNISSNAPSSVAVGGRYGSVSSSTKSFSTATPRLAIYARGGSHSSAVNGASYANNSGNALGGGVWTPSLLKSVSKYFRPAAAASSSDYGAAASVASIHGSASSRALLPQLSTDGATATTVADVAAPRSFLDRLLGRHAAVTAPAAAADGRFVGASSSISSATTAPPGGDFDASSQHARDVGRYAAPSTAASGAAIANGGGSGSGRGADSRALLTPGPTAAASASALGSNNAASARSTGFTSSGGGRGGDHALNTSAASTSSSSRRHHRHIDAVGSSSGGGGSSRAHHASGGGGVITALGGSAARYLSSAPVYFDGDARGVDADVENHRLRLLARRDESFAADAEGLLPLHHSSAQPTNVHNAAGTNITHNGGGRGRLSSSEYGAAPGVFVGAIMPAVFESNAATVSPGSSSGGGSGGVHGGAAPATSAAAATAAAAGVSSVSSTSSLSTLSSTHSHAPQPQPQQQAQQTASAPTDRSGLKLKFDPSRDDEESGDEDTGAAAADLKLKFDESGLMSPLSLNSSAIRSPVGRGRTSTLGVEGDDTLVIVKENSSRRVQPGMQLQPSSGAANSGSGSSRRQPSPDRTPTATSTSGGAALSLRSDPTSISGAALSVRIDLDAIATDAGLAALKRTIRTIMTRSLSSDASRRQLRDALRVFIAIMLSSAALICVRAVISFIYNDDAATLWWFQLLVTWLPDVPPCLAYLVLMWPLDEEHTSATAYRCVCMFTSVCQRSVHVSGKYVYVRVCVQAALLMMF